MYYQYFYHQITPSPPTCHGGVVQSGVYKGLPLTNYSCGPEFADGIPGEPFAAIFTISARF
jgi:hypothetical protein